jgi:hypothetical protein
MTDNFDNFVNKILNESPMISFIDNEVKADDKQLKKLPFVEVSENLVIIRQKDSGGFIPEGWTLVYFMDSPQAAEQMKQGQMSYLIFPRGTFYSGGSPITDVWKKKFQQQGHEHILGLIEGHSNNEEIYIDMMSVRKQYRRHSINTKMIEALKDLFPKAKVSFSSPTKEGSKFIQKFKENE